MLVEMIRRRVAAVSISALLVGCTDDSKSPARDGLADAGHVRRVVTADWLNKSLSVLDYQELVQGAATRDEALIATIDLGSYAPGPIEVVVAPDGKTAVVTVGPGFFATNFMETLFGLPTDLATTGTALVVDLDARSVLAEVSPPSPPMGVAISSDGKRAFTADHSGSTLSVIDLVQRTITSSVQVGGSPEETSLSPDGTLGVVNTDSDGSIRFFDPADPATTLSAPLFIGADPGGAALIPEANRLVIGQSLPSGNQVAGFTVVNTTDPMSATVVEAQPLPGVPYGADRIPGTSHVLVTSGVAAESTGCALYEIDAAVTPATRVRTIPLPCERTGLPMSTAIDPEGQHAFVGIVGDSSLMVVDLAAGTARRIPSGLPPDSAVSQWLGAAGPTDVAITP